jgi:peptidyl-prolyl cis-trans isomerase D
LQRALITPVATNARLSVGMATPYASMMLESREGAAVGIPVEAFRAGLKASDADLQQFYARNRSRYTIPEQRVLRIARIGPERVAGVTASDQEIAAYYNANKATYAATDERSLTQVVVPDQATAGQIAARAKGGASLQAAAAPAGSNAAVSPLGGQTRQAYGSVAGDQIANAVFAAPAGAVVGPMQSDFGWVVVKVDSIKRNPGRSLDQARAEIAAKLNTDKRKQALEDLVDQVQNAIDEGSNFNEAVAAAKLTVTNTPPIMADGTSRTNAGYRAAPDLAPVIKAGFQIAANDPPEIVAMPGDKGYAVVSPGQVVPAAPAPLASIRQRVEQDWLNEQAAARARAAAASIEAHANKGVSLEDAVKRLNVALPAVRPIAARRLQLANAEGKVPPPLQMLFTIGQGKTRMVADPEGRGFFVVKVNKITPGNALIQPSLIAQMRTELQQGASQDYAEQFMAAIRNELKVKRNESAIQSLKTRLVTGS